tara:strand:+ start:5525 stop:5806 length:282 start_codon:yes stop_codon:yes gene_type:complete
MGFEKKWLDFECLEVQKETEKALCCVIQGETLWLPKSQISPDSQVKGEGQTGVITISEWIADQKGLEAKDIEVKPESAKKEAPKTVPMDDIPF